MKFLLLYFDERTHLGNIHHIFDCILKFLYLFVENQSNRNYFSENLFCLSVHLNISDHILSKIPKKIKKIQNLQKKDSNS